ncbi:MAG: diguanylate cyclase response regulator [Sideroxydans sp.]|nr:diguanylate cyclase response regulator [Sideroxydans sp.]
MTPNQNNILAKLKLSGRLPTPKGVALEVINLTQRENASNQDIVRLISADPALSVRVIKAANVLLTSSSRPIVTISDAVTVLGSRALRQLVLGIALIVDYQHGPCKQFNYPHFWAHSLLTGIYVRHLAAITRLAAVEEIFVIGLLGGIGQLAMATVYPDEFGNMLSASERQSLDELYRKELEQFGFEQAELSAAILADMNFPAIFQTLIHDYPQPESSRVVEGSREWKLMNMLHLASLMADVSLSASAERNQLARKLRADAALVAIEEESLVQVAEECAREWKEWATLLNMGARHLPSFDELFEQVDNEPEEVSVPHWPHADHDYKMRVLVVEDDRSMRALLEKMLIAAGHHVVIASNGIEALNLIEKERPQLIVTDWLMPQMDGIALCRELRRKPENRSIYVIIVTMLESADKLVEAFEAGADDYLNKPITPKIFFARLRAAQRVVQLQEEIAFDREQLIRFSAELSAANERLQGQALSDALTGLPNRRFAMERLEQEWALTKRGDRTLSCLMVDVDHFKSINDRYGHQVGDDALKLVADTLRRAARTQDVVCRYGGEEFLVICPDTDAQAAVQCAERLRTNIAAQGLRLQDGSEHKMTVSIGVAEKSEAINTLEALLIRADNNLYAAKEAGRNRTILDVSP